MRYIRLSKRCPKCEKTKEIGEFYLNKKRQVYLSWCKSCGKTRAVKSRQVLRSSQSPEDLLRKRFYDLLSSAMQHKKKGCQIICSLKIKDMREQYDKQEGRCFYTGVEMKIRKKDEKQRSLFAISLDRIDSTGGYTPDNVVFCCWGINSLKGTESPQEMYSALKLFYETAKQQKKI